MPEEIIPSEKNPLQNKRLICAPMATLSHEAYRMCVEQFGGCDEYFTEMINAGSLLNNGPFEKYYIINECAKDKIVWQLTGNKISSLAEAASVVAKLEGFGVDINMGCSAPQIYKTGAGIAWMLKPLEETEMLIKEVKAALDEEEKSFEDKINSQIKSIEDYLDKEGKIREDAMNLINGKTEQFYNDLRDYTLTYTDMGEYSFNKLWTKAYEAMAKYGNGQIDIAATLAYLDSQIAQTEAQIKSLEAAASAASNSTKNALNTVRESVEDLNHELAETVGLMNGVSNGVAFSPSFIGPLPQNGYYDKNKAYQSILDGKNTAQDYLRYLKNLPKEQIEDIKGIS